MPLEGSLKTVDDMRTVHRFVVMGWVGIIGLTFALSASAQTDPAAAAAECIGELERAQQAADEEDSGMAMVLLDMASEPCRGARDALLAAIEAEPDSAAVALSTLWQMELRRARLYTSMEQCSDARATIQNVSAQAALPASVEADFARTAYAALACGPSPGSPTGGTLSVTPGMADSYHSGTALGEQDASLMSADCWGMIPLSPTYRLEVTADMQLSISAYGTGDLVMVANGPGGIFCNDDWDGLNPAISEYFVAGTWDLYIGEYSSGSFGQEFSLTLSANALWGTATSTTYPTYGEVYVGPSYGRTTLSGDVWGIHEAATAIDSSCTGFVAENPDFRMYVDSTSETWVTVTGSTGADLTLAVRGPSGVYCVDDSLGTNPQLHETLAAGSYDIWIGDKAGASTGASYGVQFSGYDPMLVLATDPQHGEVTLGPGDSPAILSGSVAGTIPASDFFGSSCYGSIGTGPSHRLSLSGDSMVEIVARSTASADLVIAVTGPAGTFCNDDYDGLNPGIRQWLTTGDYLVYVGELSTTGTTSPFTTTISISTGTPPPDLTALTSGLFGQVSVGYGLGTATHSGTSGGPRSASDLDASCRGYISEEPSFILDVSDYVYTDMRVMAEGDTTLVLMGPDGTFCNDDHSGVNPGLQQYLSPGRYGVWIGSYASDQAFNFMITFSGEGY